LRASFPIDWSEGKLEIAPNAPVSARASLTNLPIAPFLDPGGAVSHAAGTLSGEVSVKGPLDDPHPSGHLELQNAELTATALAQPLHGVSGRFDFSPTHLDITRFEARDRDGVLRLDGRVNVQGKTALSAKLNVVAKDFPLRQQGQVVATTSAHATVEAKISPSRTDVSLRLMDADTWLEKAQVRVGMKLNPHSDFVIDGKRTAQPATPAPPGTAGAAAGPATASEPSERTSVLKLDATDHFWVKREDFAIQLSTHLVAHMDDSQTRVIGRVDVHRGYLDLMGRVFEIQRGSHLEFTGSNVPDPVVAIEASHERRSSGKTVRVKISGRGSRPELSFFVDEAEVSAGEALEELVGRRGSDTEQSAQSDAASFVSGLTAGLLATSARRELGAAAPIIMIEPGDQTGDGRVRAGFELDALIPDALASLITGVYLEGIVAKEGAGQQNSTQAGVLVELYFPHQLFSTGQWGPGTTWSLDWGWAL
jgi:autotransporter translocation and assembly factor TamB